MEPRRIYLDNNATTPVDPRVLEVMLPYFHEMPGNAASRHHPFGWEADEAAGKARQQLADLAGVEANEIIFTSGATESDNLALKGVFELYARKGNHIITLQTEHKAVIDSCKRIEKMGGEVTYLPVGSDGIVDPDKLESAIKDNTILVSVMWANNETGVIQPMRQIGEICARHNVLFMSDATQAVGKIPVRPKEAGVHLMAFTAHKMYGPKGVGALFVNHRRPRVKLAPLLDGGGHEQGMRSGTLNIPGIVGFGKAAEIAALEMKEEAYRLKKLRDKLESAILNQVEEAYVNGSTMHRLPHVTSIAFRHVKGEELMTQFNREVAVSSGSACTSDNPDPSHVLLALGLGAERAHATIRFSLGRFNTEADIDIAIEAVVKGVNHLRKISPVWEMFKEGIDLEDAYAWKNH